MLNITTGVEKTPIKTVIYGAEGVGKSSLAAKFPNALFLDTEGGTSRLDVRRIKITGWEELLATVKEIIANPEVCKSLVIDTADWAESFCIDYICTKYRQVSIESFGYGKGYTYLQEEFGEFLKFLNKLTEVGINPVIIAHGKPRKFELPDEQGAFDRYETKLTRQVAPLIKEWCDMLLFCNYKTFVVTTENNAKKAQGGKRVMYTTHNPCWDAKNRFNLPDELDLDFAAIAHLFSDVPTKKNTPKKEEPKAENLVEKVKKLVADNGITEGQLESLVIAKGHYPEGTILEEYSLEFINRWVIPNFKKIVQTIKETNNGGNE